VRAIQYYKTKKRYYLHKLAKNPAIKESSVFLINLKEKKQWEKFLNPDLMRFSKRELSAFINLDERQLISDMN